MKKIVSFMMILKIITISLHASDNNTLHTFNSGEIISSNKINHNFSLNSNYKVFSNGLNIGYLVNALFGTNGYALIINSKGYMFQLKWDGDLFSFSNLWTYYLNSSCSGQKYINSQYAPSGLVLKLSTGGNNYSAYFIDKDEQVETHDSSWHKNPESGACAPLGYSAKLFKIYENDNNTTGVNESYQLPIKIKNQ